jgi:hypothetical protein
MQVPELSLPQRLFLSERTGKFAFGHVFRVNEPIAFAETTPGAGLGYWRCDLSLGERLTWSDTVYDLFGFAVGSAVARSEAVGCYSEGSRVVLERLRSFAMDNLCGFILDAKMSGMASGAERLRVLAVPIVSDGALTGLHGLKRAI